MAADEACGIIDGPATDARTSLAAVTCREGERWERGRENDGTCRVRG